MPHNHTRLIAALTTAFGIGQIVGPLTAAWLAARQHSFDAPLMIAVLVLMAAFGLVLAQTRGVAEPAGEIRQ
ncbi:MAG TPA: YbfB/YjiJ family MFS transporter, partial [Acidiferrobacteraceae bacterium]|nr:YbfB/YjiJ family MFS transporter [Acidiferrobacteraceae bacterium]